MKTTSLVPCRRRRFWRLVTAISTVGAVACSAVRVDRPLRDFEDPKSADTASADTTSADTASADTASADTASADTASADGTRPDGTRPDGGIPPTAADSTPSAAPSSSNEPGESVSIDSGPTTATPPAPTSQAAGPETAASEPGDGPDSTTSSTSSEPPVEPPCALSVTTPGSGVHVSPSGTDAAECGDAQAPCRTITFAQGRASELAVDYVYLARGQYAEALVVTAPIALIGGWWENADAWTRTCGARADDTVVNSPASIGLLAELAGTVHVESLTIRASPTNNTPGESRYGVFARGENTVLRLEAVTIQASSASPGVSGTSGTTVPAPNCTAGNGADGPAAPTTPATSAGYFDANGYVRGDASDGANGNPGQGGSDGQAVSYACTFCNGSCMGVAGASKTASGGAHGCGGGYGSGGGGGTGGGASVGLFAWTARVELGQSVRVIAGDGGDGGDGGAGGAGQTGTPGSSGEEVECNPGTSCGSPCSDDVRGDPGTRGGTGSSGAAGGGGAGGWSVALVGTDGAFSGVVSASMLYGRAGISLGSGPTGQSVALFTIP